MVKTDLETDTWFRRKLLSKFQKHTICLVMAHGLFICSDIILLRPTMVVHVAREKERSRIRAPSSFSGPTPSDSLAGALLYGGVWQGFTRSRSRSRSRSPANNLLMFTFNYATEQLCEVQF